MAVIKIKNQSIFIYSKSPLKSLNSFSTENALLEIPFSSKFLAPLPVAPNGFITSRLCGGTSRIARSLIKLFKFEIRSFEF